MNTNQYCIIMAGGIGSRFWPLSRTEKPKQFVDALGVGRTFIQLTYDRFARFIPRENFRVVTGEAYKALTLEQLPMLTPEQVLTEPARRNTAPCIAYATYKLYAQNPGATVAVTPADQFIGNEALFEKIITSNLAYAAAHEALVTVGITPSYPATGYGYIQFAAAATEAPVTKVVAFKEKPDLSTATRFLASGDYVWNSGMFIWSLSSVKKALERLLPDIATAFASISDLYGTPREQQVVNETYLACRSISIDYGVMEAADNVYVSRCADLGWSDVGTWGSLYTQLAKDGHDNALSGGATFCRNTESCLVKQTNPGKRVVIDGLRDYVVVDTPDVLMICPRTDEERIKKLIEAANE